MNTDESAIRALIEQWHDATAEGDVDAVLGLMSEDVEFLVPGREPMRGRDAFEAGLRGLLENHRVHSRGDVQEIEISGDLAYAVNLLTVRVRAVDTGQENVRSGYALSVFRKQPNGAWLLIRDANLLAGS